MCYTKPCVILNHVPVLIHRGTASPGRQGNPARPQPPVSARSVGLGRVHLSCGRGQAVRAVPAPTTAAAWPALIPGQGEPVCRHCCAAVAGDGSEIVADSSGTAVGGVLSQRVAAGRAALVLAGVLCIQAMPDPCLPRHHAQEVRPNPLH